MNKEYKQFLDNLGVPDKIEDIDNKIYFYWRDRIKKIRDDIVYCYGDHREFCEIFDCKDCDCGKDMFDVMAEDIKKIFKKYL